jgi:DNA-binding LacI/PurR family transcriptional regulator
MNGSNEGIMSLRLKDIAQAAGVSVSTVSLVINNRPGIGDATRAKVMDIIKKSGYKPNFAQIDETAGTKNLRFIKYTKHGKVVDDNGFIGAVIDGVNIGARKLGYDVILTTINEESQDTMIDLVTDRSVSGVMVLGTELNAEDLFFLETMTVPVVIVDSYFEFLDCDCVVMNNMDASFKAVKYLHGKGYRKIGHFESSVIINNFTQRKEGYIKALEYFGLVYNPAHSYQLESTLAGSYQDMLRILEGNPELPEAIFADNDTIAVGAMKALKEHKIRIPEDLAIIGFDDIPFCLMIKPSLSTMRIFKEEIGEIAVKRLIEKIETGDRSIIKIQVGAELVERDSTK